MISSLNQSPLGLEGFGSGETANAQASFSLATSLSAVPTIEFKGCASPSMQSSLQAWSTVSVYGSASFSLTATLAADPTMPVVLGYARPGMTTTLRAQAALTASGYAAISGTFALNAKPTHDMVISAQFGINTYFTNTYRVFNSLPAGDGRRVIVPEESRSVAPDSQPAVVVASERRRVVVPRSPRTVLIAA
jgi:hypothetical protein